MTQDGETAAPRLHDAHAEQAILGSILLDSRAVNAVQGAGLALEDLFLPAHRAIYRAICGMVERGHPIDPVTLDATLRAAGDEAMAGGLVYLGELQAQVPTAANVLHYVGIVRGHAMRRALVALCAQVGQEAGACVGDVQEFADGVAERFCTVAQRGAVRTPYRKLRAVLAALFDAIGHRADAGRTTSGVPTTVASLDRITAGFQPGHLVVLGGRPSTGKTSLACNLAVNAALAHGVPVLVFSLEMTVEELAERMACDVARVDTNRVRTGSLDADHWTRLTAAAGDLGRAPIWIDDTPANTLMQVRARARAWRADRNCGHGEPGTGLVIVDYLQLLRAPLRDRSREQEVSAISAGLKALAKELRLPVLALSQLSRRVEERADRKPVLADLRESGSLEQDADVVLFLWCNPKEEDKTVRRLLVAKHRSGESGGEVPLRFDAKHTRFEEIADGAGEAF